MMNGRIMAVDPGEKRIGLAISDETGTIARGLCVLKHVSLQIDCGEIVNLAEKNEVVKIIVGNPLGMDGEERPQSRHAKKVADTITQLSDIPVILWDEHGSTQQARAIRLETGANRSRRGGHLDEVAAAVILQSWLESNEMDKS